MIIQIRVDDRLIHGQIAVVWSKYFATNHLVVANDQAAKNEVQQMTLKMATPNGVKVLIRSVDDAECGCRLYTKGIGSIERNRQA